MSGSERLFYDKSVTVFDKGIIIRHLTIGASLNETVAIRENQSGHSTHKFKIISVFKTKCPKDREWTAIKEHVILNF